jgi:hypothetical protein
LHPAKKYPGSDLEVKKAPDSGSATINKTQAISLNKIKKQNKKTGAGYLSYSILQQRTNGPRSILKNKKTY